MSYTNGLDKPSDYFNTKLYAGNGTDDHAITGVGFQPDLTWLKTRASGSHYWFDNVRGATKFIKSDGTDAEGTASSTLKSFDTDGFTLGTSGAVNSGTENFASWNWLAGGTASSNTDGSITSTVSANTTSGFSIVSYTGTGSAGTVGHGLGSAPAFYVIKQRDAVGGWIVYHKGNTSAPETDYLRLDKTDATVDDAIFNDTAPTSSVFSIGINAPVNTSSGTYVAYCFAEKKGFSSFGSYVGNGSSDGTFIYTGFRPAFIIAKESSEARDWQLWDNKRLGYNATGGNKNLLPNSSNAEDTYADIDILSNGFKLRSTSSAHNKVSQTYIYMAFAESPLVGTNNTPATAR